MGQSNLAQKWLAATKAYKVWFRTHTTALWPMEQTSLLSAKSLLAIAHDCETGLLTTKHAIREFHSHAQNVRALHQSEA